MAAAQGLGIHAYAGAITANRAFTEETGFASRVGSRWCSISTSRSSCSKENRRAGLGTRALPPGTSAYPLDQAKALLRKQHTTYVYGWATWKPVGRRHCNPVSIRNSTDLRQSSLPLRATSRWFPAASISRILPSSPRGQGRTQASRLNACLSYAVTVVNEEQETEASDSEYESSDEENDASVKEESPSLCVESMLKKYREALSNNDEAAINDLDAKFQALEDEKSTYAKQVATLNEEALSLKERLLRLKADFDNFRKRSERERIAVGANVKGDVVNSLLPMVDNFERAKTQLKIETEGEQQIDNSYQGIYKQFVEIMKGLGVSAVETVGKKFDPNLHEAIMREESSQYAEGVVIEEFRRGFMLGDKLLRPSMVKVSSGPPDVATSEPVDNEGASEVAEEAVEEAA